MATSSHNGQYYKLGEEYAGRSRITGSPWPRKTAGTTKNYHLLEEGPGTGDKPGAAIAIVAGGQATRDLRGKFYSIASLYFEPIWVFYRGESTDRLTDLAGKRIAIGTKGGGGRLLALQLLKTAGAIAEGRTTMKKRRTPSKQPCRLKQPCPLRPSTMPATMPVTYR